jgi:hypothetical protein
MPIRSVSSHYAAPDYYMNYYTRGPVFMQSVGALGGKCYTDVTASLAPKTGVRRPERQRVFV